jgi:Tol biopolymer transport system component/DNA-binding winged helix-turn-helix (wHTH) protein
MEEHQNQPPPIVFGPYEFDGAAGELRKHGTRLRLTGQPLRILEILLERSGQVVSREEIQQKLWSGTTFVDFHHGLNAAISKLRQTLGDSANKPRYIETIPGRGYRFMGLIEFPVQGPSRKPVLEMVPSLPNPSSQDDGAPTNGPLFRPSRPFLNMPPRLAILGAPLLVLAAILILWRFPLPSRTPAVTPQAVRFRVAVPETLRLSGSETFSLSPDGSTLVYHAVGSDGVQRLWAQRLNSLEPRVLPGTESIDDSPAFWSPDSKQVAYYSNGELRKTDLTGGAPQTLCAVPGIVSGGSWNRDGVIIFGPVTGPLMRVSENGGRAVAITALDPGRMERNHLFPTFLPDGRHFLYSRLSSVAENSGIYLGSLEAAPAEQESKRLVASPFGAAFAAFPHGNGDLLYQRESTLWAREFDTSRLEITGEPVLVAERVGSHRGFGFFGTSESGVLVHRSGLGETVQLAWFDRHGKRLASVGEPIDVYSAPILSPDLAHIAVARFESGVDIWVYDLTRDVKQRLTSHPALDTDPVWSPDGKRIAFSSSRGGRYDLYQTAVTGESAEELLYSSGESKFITSWSADGRFLLFQARAGGASWDIWVLPLGGDGKRTPIPLIHTPANERSGTFSPDSGWVAYVSDESGTGEVYVQPFSPLASGASAAGPRVLISRGGGTQPSWRTDGKELFYRAPDGMMMSVAVRADSTFRPGAPQPLFRTSLAWFSRAGATADGSRFLIATPVEQSPPQNFTVVLNWQAELKRGGR